MINLKHRASELTYKYSITKKKLYTLWVGDNTQITELYLPDTWFLRVLPEWIESKGEVDFLILCKGRSCDYHGLGGILSALIKLGFKIEGKDNGVLNYIHLFKGQK